MSERHKPHNGRDRDGHYRVRHADLSDLLEDPNGVDYLRDDVRLGGAVADTSPTVGLEAERISRLAEENRENVDRLVGRTNGTAKKRGGRGRRR